MTKAIGQNATDGAVSGIGPDPIDWLAMIAKVASRGINGLTTESNTLDYNRLFSAAAAEYKSRIGAERQSRLAQEIVDAIDGAIGAFLKGKLANFATDCVSHRVFAAHKAAQKMFVRAEVIRRESTMSLKEQRFFAVLHVNACTKRLDKAVAENRHESVPKAQKALDKALDTQKSINAAIEAMETTKPE